MNKKILNEVGGRSHITLTTVLRGMQDFQLMH